MATWTTELEARVELDEELKGPLMAALVAAFPEPKPAQAFGAGRLRARFEVEADNELEAARLAADRFAKAFLRRCRRFSNRSPRGSYLSSALPRSTSSQRRPALLEPACAPHSDLALSRRVRLEGMVLFKHR
jgi:hypothetical protein